MTQKDKISNLKDYFLQIRKRPAMYLGTSTITKLGDHLHGYHMACQLNDIVNPIDKNFFDNFNEFVYRYYGVTTAAPWQSVILEQCFGKEQNALNTFFELFDLFIENFKPIDTKRIILAFLDKLIFEQEEMKVKLGDNYFSVLTDTVELIKENAMTNFKYDYDFILEQLDEKAEQIPEFKNVLKELDVRQFE